MTLFNVKQPNFIRYSTTLGSTIAIHRARPGKAKYYMFILHAQTFDLKLPNL